jgi:ribosomal protein S18 acetylase RimI-like enzyme
VGYESRAVEIRVATLADVELLVRLNGYVHAPHVEAEPDTYRETEPRAVAEWFRERLSRGEIEVLVAEVDGEGVGLAVTEVVERAEHVFARAQRYVVVDQLAVAPGCQRQGIGRQLLEEVHARAKDKGMPRVELDVRGFNRGALAFYEELGYEVRSLRMRRDV